MFPSDKLLNKLEVKMQAKNSIYIMPTKFGFIYTLILFTIFLIGLTYTNNMTLIIAFWMLAVFLIQMLKTHKDIKSFLHIPLKVRAQHHKSIGKRLYPLNENIQIHLEVESKYIPDIELYKNLRRGRYSATKMRITSYGVFSLFKSWKYLKLDEQVFYVYPEQIKSIHNLQEINPEIDNEEEFKQYSKYIYGMNSSKIDWKVFSRTNKLYRKEFWNPQSNDLTIDIDAISGELENKIKIACSLVYSHFQNGTCWTLKYGNQSTARSKGKEHLKSSMEFLSLL